MVLISATNSLELVSTEAAPTRPCLEHICNELRENLLKAASFLACIVVGDAVVLCCLVGDREVRGSNERGLDDDGGAHSR